MLSLTQANARLAGTVITAPVAGRVLSVGGTVGARVSPGGTGFVVLGDVTVADRAGRVHRGRRGPAGGRPGRHDHAARPARAGQRQGVPDRPGRHGLQPAGPLRRADRVRQPAGRPAARAVGHGRWSPPTRPTDVLYVASAAVVPTSGDGVGTVTVTVGWPGRAADGPVRPARRPVHRDHGRAGRGRRGVSSAWQYIG